MNNKRLKLPNGFGSITKKSGRRRKPFEIRKWIDGKQKVIGYEVTYESALAFLCEGLAPSYPFPVPHCYLPIAM